MKYAVNPTIPASFFDWSHYISKEERNGFWSPQEKQSSGGQTAFQRVEHNNTS